MPISFVPRERQYFTLFREDVANVMESLKTLAGLLNAPSDQFSELQERLRELEHRGDDITHRIIRELNETFITPFDRDDIYALASTLDDVIDLADEAADSIVLSCIDHVTPEACHLGDLLLQMGREMVQAIDGLDTRRDMQRHWVALHELENQGDAVTRRAIGHLFQGANDPIFVLKWKGIYGLLEQTIDRAEDVANILESIAIKNA